MTRWFQLAAGAAAVITLLAASEVRAQISDDAIRIGVLTDMSGPAADPTGQGSVFAAEMAIADFGGSINGKPIQLLSANHQLKPDVGAAIARQWYDIEKVDLIVDVPVSAVGWRFRRSPVRENDF